MGKGTIELKVESNIPLVVIQPIRSNSELTLLRVVETGETGLAARIGGVAYARRPELDEGHVFLSQDFSFLPEGSRDVTLIYSGGFLRGETVFFHLHDESIDHSPDVVETVLVRFETSSGDLELFRLTASGPASADFYGYAMTTLPDAMEHGDGFLSVKSNDIITANYSDAFDGEDRRVQLAVVDPALRVFDAQTGVPVDDAIVRIVNAGTGLAATVYGIDGLSRITETIVTGRDVFDVAGNTYTAGAGEARIPHLKPGTYRLEVEPPLGYLYPSDRPVAEITGIGTESFRLLPGAWGRDFEISQGGPPVFDVPVDSRRALFLQKTVGRSEIDIGETVRFGLTMRNEADEPTADLVLTDTLPEGFRPVSGSLTLNGDPVSPVFDAASGRLTLAVGTLAPRGTVAFDYTARIGVGTRIGMHETSATARAPLGFRSNTARLILTVTDPLQHDRSYVVGSVVTGECGVPHETMPGTGIRARLLTETGTQIITDRDGRFHIEGLTTVRHVLRLDETSLPEGVTPLACPEDLRPGDRAASRLIDVKGGLIRNVVFRLHDSRSKPESALPVEGDAGATGAGAGAAQGDAPAQASEQSGFEAMPALVERPSMDYEPEDLKDFEGLVLVYPSGTATLNRPLFDVGIAYPFGHKIELRINGRAANEDRYEGIIGNKTARVAMRQWRGLETPEGRTRIEVVMRDEEGEEKARITRRFDETGALQSTSAISAPPPDSDADPADSKPETGTTPPVPTARTISADDLAGLPAKAQIVYPAAETPVPGTTFDLGIALPFGTEIDVTVDGKPIDSALSRPSIVNRKARLSLRRWSGVPFGNGIVSVTATARGGTKRQIERAYTRGPAPAPDNAVAAREKSTTGTQTAQGASGDTKKAQDAPGGIDLESLPRELQFVYPEEDASLADPSLRLGIAHPLGTRLRVTVGGIAPSDLLSEKGIISRKAGLSLKRWRGIDMPDGMTEIVAVTLDRAGNILDTVTRRVYYVTEAAQATFLPEQSILVADGETQSVIAVRLVDSAGRPLHEGRRIAATLALPYRSALSFRRFEDDPLAAARSTRTPLTVEEDGIARLVLHPTTQSGEVDLRVSLGTDEKRLRPWIASAPRPWIVVGLAEGTAGYTLIDDKLEGDRADDWDDIKVDGKLAFYAKGAIRGDWLLTLAYDSEADFSEDPVNERIDPTEYYPVYGDASLRTEDARSRYPLYVRLERDQFFAMFGDYDTGLNRTTLGAYSRQLSGFKTVYEGKTLSVVAFAAEADRQFGRVELQANRGIGPYVAGAGIARNSETVTLVTRPRDRLDTSLTETILTPDIDYDIDYETGTVILTLPPEAVDLDFNPRFVVIGFERGVADPGTITAGGRVALRVLDDRLELGATAIHEEGGSMDARSDLLAFDATVKLTDSLEIEAEIAASRAQDDGEETEGTAYRAEARYRRKRWGARVYVHEAETDFGVANRPVGQSGRRIVGAEIHATIDDPFLRDPETDRPVTIDLRATATHDRNLASEAQRDSVEIGIARIIDLGGNGWDQVRVELGYRGERDRTATGETGTTHRAVGKTATSVLDGRAVLSVEREQTIHATGEVTTPDTTRLALRAALTERIEAAIGVELLDDSLDDANLTAGLSATAWKGGTVEAGMTASRGAGSGAGDRINATLGAQQDIKVTDSLSVTLRAGRTQPLAGSDSPVVNALFSQAAGEAFTTLSAGASYEARGWRTSVRVDGLHSEDSQRIDARGAVLRDVSHGLKLAAAFDTGTVRTDDGTTDTYSLTLAGAYRSADRRTNGLQRLEAAIAGDGTRTAIHSLSLAHDLTARLSLAGVHALRFSDSGEGDTGSGAFTQFVGGDVYYRFLDNWRAGLHGDTLASLDGSEAKFAFGASVGYSPRAGMLMTLGYNIDGFKDADFADTNHTEQGAYLRFSFSFDENDIGLLLPRFVGDFFR